MSDSIISVSQLSKTYRIYQKPVDRLKETLSPSKKVYGQDFFALNDISFEIQRGENIGIIGTNGSGKSTLLKIITGVLSPSSGEVNVRGKIAALLELGAGFNPEYTGIENIKLNGTMMGFTEEEMEGKLEEILAFADIGDFVHQPVKTYSSGMFARLAFAVAINVEPEILIVDEALSVGDVFFQAKCFKKIEELRQKDTTILLVTHDLSTVLQSCSRALLIHKGDMLGIGDTKTLVDDYKKIMVGQPYRKKDGNANEVSSEHLEETVPLLSIQQGGEFINPAYTEYGTKQAQIVEIGIYNEEGTLTNMIEKNTTFTVKYKVFFHEEIKDPIFTFSIKDVKGNILTGTNSMLEKKLVEVAKQGESYHITYSQKMTLQGGDYLISTSCTGFVNDNLIAYHRLYDIMNIHVISEKNTGGFFDMNSELIIEKE